MKKLLPKLISAILVTFMLTSTLFSCGSAPDDSFDGSLGSDGLSSDQGINPPNPGLNADVDDEDAPTPIVDVADFPSGSFPIFDGKTYTAKVINADKASADERQVATSLRTALKNKTTADVEASTDYAKADANVYEILVGETNRTESKDVYDSTAYNNYGIKIIGKKLIVYFSTAAEGEELVKAINKAITSNGKGLFWISGTLSVSNVVSVQLTGVPQYPDGTKTTSDCGDNTQMITAKSTSLNSFNTYCNTLTTSGYTEYSKRENIDGNYFRTYTKGSTAITAYFSNGTKQAKIIVGPIKDIPSKDKDTTAETVKPSVTMIGPSESVSGSLTMIYQLANGKFIIVDGGIILADRIYKELRELQPNAKSYTIAAWFISHPHIDHQDGIEYFLEQHGRDVDIEGIYFNYATSSYYNSLSSGDHQAESNKEGPRVATLREVVAKYASRTTKIVKPHTGQIYEFGSAKVEIISTVEDIIPTKLPHVNESSMVIRVTVAGQSTMILADASSTMKGIIRNMYDSHVKSDMVTLAHHGVWDTTPALYNEINAKVLFWPNNSKGARQYYTDKSTTSEARKSIQAALDNAKDVFLAKGTDTKLNLPYTPVGNKDKFISDHLK